MEEHRSDGNRCLGRVLADKYSNGSLVSPKTLIPLPRDIAKFNRGGNWSGKRDSNSRLPPWQGGALPTELFPHITRNADRRSILAQAAGVSIPFGP